MTIEFKTPNLQFAAWLLSAKILTYARTETGSRKSQWLFVFIDPDRRGPTLEAEFFNSDPRCRSRNTTNPFAF